MNAQDKAVIENWLEAQLEVAFQKSIKCENDKQLKKYWDARYDHVDSLICKIRMTKEAVSA